MSSAFDKNAQFPFQRCVGTPPMDFQKLAAFAAFVMFCGVLPHNMRHRTGHDEVSAFKQKNKQTNQFSTLFVYSIQYLLIIFK